MARCSCEGKQSSCDQVLPGQRAPSPLPAPAPAPAGSGQWHPVPLLRDAAPATVMGTQRYLRAARSRPQEQREAHRPLSVQRSQCRAAAAPGTAAAPPRPFRQLSCCDSKPLCSAVAWLFSQQEGKATTSSTQNTPDCFLSSM